MESENISAINSPQVESDHYYQSEYDTKGRFASYWHQINEIVSLAPSSVLEIGIGTGFLSTYLKQRNINITTMDIDERLKPDILGSVLKIPCSDNKFDLVAAFQLLEHLPYENFSKALNEIHRVTKKYTVLSLPDCTRAYRFELQIPRIKDLRILIPMPRLKPSLHRFDGQHYWEIGKAGYPLRRVFEDIRVVGFEVIKCYRVFEMPYHRFFVLEKKGESKDE